MRTPLTALLLVSASLAQDGDLAAYRRYQATVADTVGMVHDAHARRLAKRHGLRILNVTWEDTGRFKHSSVGPNISDMTIQVQLLNPRTEKSRLYCMPVIRYPNFSDRTGDFRIDKFELLVGNERARGRPAWSDGRPPAGALRRVKLREYLGNLRKYLHKPGSWRGRRGSLLAERDTHVLVSAQACFLPIPKAGTAEFNPVLFNYQSVRGDPAVLAILATREGTSATIIDNVRDAFAAGRAWGQRLFFNKSGERAVLTGKRLSDHAQQAGDGDESVRPEAGGHGLNMVLLIQVPLRQHRPRPRTEEFDDEGVPTPGAAAGVKKKSDVENAVIGHGRVEGPYTEIDGLKIRRDARFPIRVTVQFYKATSNGKLSRGDMAAIAAQIKRVYRQAEYVGSLVVQGHTGRPTEYDGNKVEHPGWWHEFWLRHEKNTGQTCHDAMLMLRDLLGPGWTPASPAELAAAIRRARGDKTGS